MKEFHDQAHKMIITWQETGMDGVRRIEKRCIRTGCKWITREEGWYGDTALYNGAKNTKRSTVVKTK